MQPGEVWSTEPPRRANTQASPDDQSHGSASGSPDARQPTLLVDTTTTQQAPGGRTILSAPIPSPMEMQPMLTPSGFDRQFLMPQSPLMYPMGTGSGYSPFVTTPASMPFGLGPLTSRAPQQVSPTYQAPLQYSNGSPATQFPVGGGGNGRGFDAPLMSPSTGTSGAHSSQSPFASPSMATPSSAPAAAPYISMSPAPTTAPPSTPSQPTQQDMAGLVNLLQQLEQLRGASHDDPKRIKDLTTSEVAAYSTTLHRVGLEPWLARFLNLMRNKHPTVAELLCMNVSQAREAINKDLKMRIADGYLSRQVDCVLDANSDRVQAFRLRLDNNLEAASSGVLKLAYIRDMCNLTHGTEVRLAEREFDEKTFFKSHMSRDEAVKAAWELTNEFKLLKRCSDVESIMFEILKKLPERVEHKASTLFDEISRGQVIGCVRYTLDQFIEVVGITLSSGEGARGFIRTHNKNQGTSKAAFKPQANQTEVVNTNNDTRTLTCVACGRDGHHAKNCPTSCPTCGMRCCPGNFGRPCLVQTNADVPQSVMNAKGNALPAHIRGWLVEANKKWRAGNGGNNNSYGNRVGRGGGRGNGQGGFNRSANAAEANVADADTCSEQVEQQQINCCEVIAEYESSDDEGYFPNAKVCAAEKQTTMGEDYDVQCSPCQGMADLETAIAARLGLTRREAIRGVIASGLDSIPMLEWLLTISWEQYSELVEALVLDAGLTSNERRCMLREDLLDAETQATQHMELEATESNSDAKQCQTRTQNRGDVIAHVQVEQNHMKQADDPTTMGIKARGEKIRGHSAGVVAILIMTTIGLASGMEIRGSLQEYMAPSALDMCDRYNCTPYDEIHTPGGGGQETGLEWQGTFPDCATKTRQKTGEGVLAMYTFQKPDDGITEVIAHVNNGYLSGESKFLSEEPNYPDSALQKGPGRATKLGRKTGKGVLAMYAFQKPDDGITEMITHVDDFLCEGSNCRIADAMQARLGDQIGEMSSRENLEKFAGYQHTQGQVKRAIMGAKQSKPGESGMTIAKDLRDRWLTADDTTSISHAGHFLRHYPSLRKRNASGMIAMCKSTTNKWPTNFLINQFACDKIKKAAEHANDSTSYVTNKHTSMRTSNSKVGSSEVGS